MLVHVLPDNSVEESQSDIPLLLVEEAHTSLLLIHIILHHPSIDHVHTRGRAPSLGDLLHSDFHVTTQHPPCAKVLPFPGPLPALREHHVGDQVQRDDLGVVSAWKCL